MTSSKIQSRSGLKKIVNRLKGEGKTTVFANGCFDIIHRGHVELLEKAGSLGDALIVAINSDGSVKKIKGSGRPLNNFSDRARVLAALESVDYVTSFSETDPALIIKELEPDILVKGGDWKIDDVIGRDFVESYGGKVEIIPFVSGYSTSSLLNKLNSKP